MNVNIQESDMNSSFSDMGSGDRSISFEKHLRIVLWLEDPVQRKPYFPCISEVAAYHAGLRNLSKTIKAACRSREEQRGKRGDMRC